MSNKSLFRISIVQPKMDLSTDVVSTGKKSSASKRKQPSKFQKQHLMVDHDFFRIRSSSKQRNIVQNSDLLLAPSASKELKKQSRLQSARVRKKDDIVQFSSVQLNTGPTYRKNTPRRRKKSYDQLKKMNELNIDDFMIKKQDIEDGEKNQLISFWKTRNKFVKLIMHIQSSTWDPTDHQSILKVHGYLSLLQRNYIVMDYLAGNTLFNTVAQFGSYKQSLASKIIHNLVVAVINCHSRNFVHGRINPNNLWTNQDGQILLDLVKSNEEVPEQGEKMQNLFYFAPQVLEQGWISPKADVWGVGCITMFMLTGCSIQTSFLHPYGENYYLSPPISATKRQQMCKLRQIRIKYGSSQRRVQQTTDSNSHCFSRQALSFIKACLSVSYKTRPDLQVLIDHPFLTNYQ